MRAARHRRRGGGAARPLARRQPGCETSPAGRGPHRAHARLAAGTVRDGGPPGGSRCGAGRGAGALRSPGTAPRQHHRVASTHVPDVLRPQRKALRDHARSALPVPERAARRSPGAPVVRHQRGGRLRAAHRRGRHRQDHDRGVVLVVDEAQNLSPDVLEQVRLLTNLETNTQKLLQIILIGQPELRELLSRNELRQLAQRITGRYHLNPLSHDETLAYVRHRLRVAGATTDMFAPAALNETFRLSHGVPRVINVICDRALLGAYSLDRHRVTTNLVRAAAAEVFGRRFTPHWLPWALTAGIAALLSIATVTLWNLQPWSTRSGA
ncbi:MAG: hypothetical protein E6K50_02760, partial [Gammaproteobacteria bacterium]